MNEVYHCAVENNAKSSVAFEPLAPEVGAMTVYFNDINLWWHPGLTIAFSLIPLLGLIAAYSYMIIGLTMLKAWGEFMKSGIDVLVPPYKDIVQLEYTTS